MKITINTIYVVLIIILLVMGFSCASMANKLNSIEQQLAVCLPASQREGGAE